MNALILGDYTNFKYHPLTNMDRSVTDLLEGHAETVCTEDYGQLSREHITGYDLVIAYTDCWNRELPEEQVEGLLGYVRGGGGLLVIHNGISLQVNEALMRMIGARFTGHPPYCPLEIRPAGGDHPIVRGLGPFHVADEPYRFEFIDSFKPEILLEYEHEGRIWPAGWTHAYGKGRVVYLMNGHDGGPFLQPVYREIILRSALMLMKP